MQIPLPKKIKFGDEMVDETMQQYVERLMGHKEMVLEFQNPARRLAVIQKQWYLLLKEQK